MLMSRAVVHFHTIFTGTSDDFTTIELKCRHGEFVSMRFDYTSRSDVPYLISVWAFIDYDRSP